jgi:hypothetical protein
VLLRYVRFANELRSYGTNQDGQHDRPGSSSVMSSVWRKSVRATAAVIVRWLGRPAEAAVVPHFRSNGFRCGLAKRDYCRACGQQRAYLCCRAFFLKSRPIVHRLSILPPWRTPHRPLASGDARARRSDVMRTSGPPDQHAHDHGRSDHVH